MKKGNPFQVEPLPKAFYYPSKEKELTNKEKKVCLSVPVPQQNKVTSPEDLKFLKDTNALKVQEIPTRENGSFGEQSSSSQFNESWPSTEQNGSHSTMVSDITSPEMSQQMKEWLSGKPDRPVTKSTLGWYINRFRNAPPTSRQIRDKSSFTNQKQGDFWWLSPPSGQSTPVLDTPPQKLKPSTSMAPMKETCKLPASTSSSPSLHTSDKFTEDLNKRAKELLERSETSIESTSTEPFPLPLKKPVVTKTRTPETIPKHTSTPDLSTKLTTNTPNPAIQSTHKNPWPEEDILYQWRLARKMEKAQERATTGRSGGPLGLSSGTQRLLNSRNRIGYSPVSGSTGLHAQHSELFSLPEAPVVTETVFDPHTPVCASTTNIISSMIPNSVPVFTTASTATQPNTSSFVSPPCRHKSKSDSRGGVPPHMHLACDILPCSCSETIPKADLKICTAKLPNQTSAPPNENHINHSNPDSEMTNKKALVDKSSCTQQDVARSNLDSKDPTSSEEQTVKEPVVIAKKTSDEHKREGRVDKRDFERKRNHLESSVQSNEKQLESINISLEENEKTVTSKMKRQTKKKQEAFDVVDNVIGKVVSEHLFSGDSSSGENESSMSESILQPEREDTEKTQPQECLPGESSEEEFADDEILKMLRQRSKDLKTQLREIDQLILDNK